MSGGDEDGGGDGGGGLILLGKGESDTAVYPEFV
jgi:hypothetical protein